MQVYGEERFVNLSPAQEDEKMKYTDYIVRDPKICGGQPVIKGTRVLLRVILASLADGDSVETILQEFPTLSEEAIHAVIAFAAKSAEEDLPIPGLPEVA